MAAASRAVLCTQGQVQQTTFSHSTTHQHNQYQESMKDIHSLLIYMSMSGAIELLH
jgi:hypothetical protein